MATAGLSNIDPSDAMRAHGVAVSASPPGQVPQFIPATGATRRPRLPQWLSVPVVFAAPLLAIGAVVALITVPIVVALALVPLLVVFPTFAWLDRIEPEPWSSRVHALLWGGAVATLVSAVVNSVVAVASSEAVAAVVSAPIIEETMKAAGLVWAVRRRELDDAVDGLIFAGWVALGFAVTEDVLYFAMAGDNGELVAIFVLRALLTPFAHPLFTAWTGFAIGRAVERGRPLGTAWWGLAIAMATHALWNGSLTLADHVEEPGIVLVVFAAFVVLFVAAIALCVRVRRRQQRSFLAAVPMLTSQYGLPAHHLAAFGSWPELRRIRRSLPRRRRRSFDALHGALARLAAMQERPTADPVAEARHLDTVRRSEDLLSAH